MVQIFLVWTERRAGKMIDVADSSAATIDYLLQQSVIQTIAWAAAEKPDRQTS